MPTTNPKEIKPPVYTDDEKLEYGYLMQSLSHMRTERDQPWPELDNMTPVEYYESNRKKDLSYLPPKKNKTDIRIVTGHTREKDTTLLSTQLNMNFEPNITAFDTDDLRVAELGDNMSDMVKKSREVENWAKAVKSAPLIVIEPGSATGTSPSDMIADFTSGLAISFTRSASGSAARRM